jgi:hypothetical protein
MVVTLHRRVHRVTSGHGSVQSPLHSQLYEQDHVQCTVEQYV